MAGLRRKQERRFFPGRSFEDFLSHLLAVESGIDPALFDWYLTNYENPVIDYPQVTSPGRVIRDPASGDFVVAKMCVREYFTALGVADIFNPDSPASVAAMQYRATNVLGFVGYQLGEAILMASGYYEPPRVRMPGSAATYASYYVGALPNEVWRGGRQTLLCRVSESGGKVVATDTNRWHGNFTGKNGLCSLQDLYCRDRQEIVIRDIIESHCRALTRSLSTKGTDVERLIAARRRPRMNDTGEAQDTELTASGLVAAAHLCGASATVELLVDGAQASDEFGTPLSCYLLEFSGYEIPFL